MERFYTEKHPSYLPTVAVSACLLGHAVRYDGSNKAHSLLHQIILPKVNVRARCPEMEAGLGVPRPPVQLVISDDGLQARGRDLPDLNVTDALRQFSRHEIDALCETPLMCGHIFKSRSPSCGLSSTPIHDSYGHIVGLGNGIYSESISAHLPWLIVTEETALDSREACEHFLQNVFIACDIQIAGIQQQLTSVHQHYSALWQHSELAKTLDAMANKNLWRDYLVMLLKILS